MTANRYEGSGPLRILLVKPHLQLLVAKRLNDFLHLEPDEFICNDPYLFYDCMHTLLPTKLKIKRFYEHFARLYRLAWSANPLRVNNVRTPYNEVLKAIVNGTKYIFALRSIHRDYLPRRVVDKKLI